MEKIIRPAQPEAVDTKRLQRRRASLAGQVAFNLAAQEQPELASQWLEKNFGTGITGWMAAALETIRQRNPQLADATFSKALSQLESESSGSTDSVMALGGYLFPEKFPRASGTGGGTWLTYSGGGEEETPEIAFDFTSMSSYGRSISTGDTNPELISRFLSVAHERCLASLSALSTSQFTEDNPALNALADALPVAAMLRPLLQQHLPEKASSLEARLNELSKQRPAENGMTLDRVLDFLADPEESADWAAQTNPENRDFQYQVQAMTAIRQGRSEQALALMDKVKSDEIKAVIRSALASKQITDAIEQGQLDSASGQARTHPDASQQIRFLIQIAEKRLEQRESEPALLCVIEAEQLLGKVDDYSRLTFAAEIVKIMARLDSESAFQSGARLVEEINKASASSNGPSPYSDPDLMIANTFLHDQSFSRLAEADFDGALALAQSIVRTETSIAAQLAVCRAALSGTDKGLSPIAQE